MLTGGNSGPGFRNRSFEDMRVSTLKLSAVALLAATTLLSAPAAMAVDLDVALLAKGGKGCGGGGTTEPGPQPGTSTCAKADVEEGTKCWMSGDVSAAHLLDLKGQGTYVTFVDDFDSNNTFLGNWGDGTKTLNHGGWTSSETLLVAPEATYFLQDFTVDMALSFHDVGLDVVNASYGMIGMARFYYPGALDSYATEKSIIDAAWSGEAVVSKAAGNDGIAVGGNVKGTTDYLGNSLIGAQSVIFVGALDFNGSTSNRAPMSYYSNYAGSETNVQDHFLVVGVDYKATGLAGTSFAAPIVAGYAAILGSKFTTASETQVANQLLDTARTDTIFGYDIAIHGQGEACLSCALAPLPESQN
jgi:subtilisin family serine protease